MKGALPAPQTTLPLPPFHPLFLPPFSPSLDFGLKCTAFWVKVQYLLRRRRKSPEKGVSAHAFEGVCRSRSSHFLIAEAQESQESQRLKRGVADSGLPPSRRRYSIGAKRKYIAAAADWESRLLGGGTLSVPSTPSGHSTYSITPFDLFECPFRPIQLPHSTYSITPFDLFDCVKGIGAELSLPMPLKLSVWSAIVSVPS